MRSLLLLSLLLDYTAGHFPLVIFEQYLGRHGLTTVPRVQLVRILENLDSGNVRTDVKFTTKGKQVSFGKKEGLFDILGTISGIVQWVTAFENQLGEAIYAAKKPLAAAASLDKEVKKHTKTKKKKKLKNSYYSTVTRSRGDLRTAHLVFKKLLTEEARRVLNIDEFNVYQKFVAKKEKAEKDKLELVYQITGSQIRGQGLA